MRLFSTLTLLSLSLPAVADTSIDQYNGGVGEVILDGVVEVPLYQLRSSSQAAVQMTVGDRTYLMAIRNSPFNYFGPRIVADQELKAKEGNKKLLNFKGEDHKFKHDIEVNYADIESAAIGELQLTDLRGRTDSEDELFEDIYDTLLAGMDEGVDFDGVIGMHSLPELAWAVVPSAGVVRFASADQGAALVQQVGGETITTTALESSLANFGKKSKLKANKIYIADAAPIVTATIGGAEVPVLLELGLHSGVISSSAAIPEDAPSDRSGDKRWTFLDTTIGKQETNSSWYLQNSVFDYLGTVPDTTLPVSGFVGRQVLNRFDLAFDPAGNTMALAAASAQKREDPLPFLLADAEAALAQAEKDAAEAEESGKESDAEEAEETPAGDPGLWKRIGELKQASGDVDGALAAHRTILEFGDTSCDGWMDLGRLQFDNNDLDGALESFTTARGHADTWWGLEQAERLEYAERLEAEKKKGLGKMFAQAGLPELPEDLKAQAASCHMASGWIAAVHMANGDLENVESIYRERFDLDRRLATLYGNSLLLRGEPAAAHEPYRQAMIARPDARDRDRMGLAMAYGDDTDQVLRILDPARLWGDGELWQLRLATLRSAEGSSAAMADLKREADSWPTRIEFQNLLLREFKAGGDTSGVEATAARLETLCEDKLLFYPRSSGINSRCARFQTTNGQLDAARKLAEAALKLDPGSPLAWLVMADISAASGDMEKASEQYKRAGQLNPFDPYYAMLLGQFLDGVGMAPEEPAEDPSNTPAAE